MCLAIPMKISAIDGFNVTCEARGQVREVSLFLMQDEPFAVGDHVMIHLGYVQQKVTQEEAEQAWALYDEMLAAPAPSSGSVTP